MPKLLISLPNGDLSKEISGEVVTIGRTSENKVQIDHHSVSAHHAKLILINGNYRIKDLDSTNRTCVNGMPVNEAELTGSCILRIGTIECIYKADKSDSSAPSGQLQSQLNELQRQMENLIKARDLIHQQNRTLTKERDEAKLDAENHLEMLADAKKQIEQLRSGSTGNVQQFHEITVNLNEAKKRVEALTKERDALLISNDELKNQLDSVTAKLNHIEHTSAQPAVAEHHGSSSASAQQQAAARVKAEMDESVEEDSDEADLAATGQRAASGGGLPGRIISGAPILSSWLNRGAKRKTPSDQPEKPDNITSVPAPVEAKSAPVPAPSAPAAPLGLPTLRLVPAPQTAIPHNSTLGSPAVKIGRVSANAIPQNPGIKPAWDILNAMRRSLHYFLRHQDELKVLQEMAESARNLTEASRSELLRPIYELSAALEALMSDLHSSPANINASTLRTIGQSIDFLATLIDESNLSRIKAPNTAKIFAIDDDEGILETIKATMEMVHLNITTSHNSAEGLAMLADQNYDLIFLDVGIPEMNGMDICSRVRAMPHHQKTPIVFLTGEATVQNRVQSTLNGGNDLIGKPFSVLELAVKAIVWIFKGQMGLV